MKLARVTTAFEHLPRSCDVTPRLSAARVAGWDANNSLPRTPKSCDFVFAPFGRRR